MKIKLSKAVLESALIFQAKNDIRYYLNGVCLKTDGRVCSTDGHRAFIGSKHNGKLKDDVILTISKSPTKKYDYAEIDIEAGSITYHHDSTIQTGVGMVSLVDGRFPDIDRIIPKELSPCDRIGFNAGYLVDLEKAAKLFHPQFSSVIFEMNGSTNAASAKLKSPCGDTATIIIMPIRID